MPHPALGFAIRSAAHPAPGAAGVPDAGDAAEDAADAAELAVVDAADAERLAVVGVIAVRVPVPKIVQWIVMRDVTIVVQPVVRVAGVVALAAPDVGLDVEMDVLGAGAHVEVVPVHQIVQVVEAVQAALADVSAAVWLKKEK